MDEPRHTRFESVECLSRDSTLKLPTLRHNWADGRARSSGGARAPNDSRDQLGERARVGQTQVPGPERHEGENTIHMPYLPRLTKTNEDKSSLHCVVFI
ncbi:hypothetical protein RRG08_063307 [Elysia crispata]|uniref:Uncharacterized protein n=1 Tax=Elysia crispata TaxID=231223 RepID=A0AAE0ZVT6_9GAST|nr:hypothetical protein RRG08_063307 [Elysia crispata]